MTEVPEKHPARIWAARGRGKARTRETTPVATTSALIARPQCMFRPKTRHLGCIGKTCGTGHSNKWVRRDHSSSSRQAADERWVSRIGGQIRRAKLTPEADGRSVHLLSAVKRWLRQLIWSEKHDDSESLVGASVERFYAVATRHEDPFRSTVKTLHGETEL